MGPPPTCERTHSSISPSHLSLPSPSSSSPLLRHFHCTFVRFLCVHLLLHSSSIIAHRKLRSSNITQRPYRYLSISKDMNVHHHTIHAHFIRAPLQTNPRISSLQPSILAAKRRRIRGSSAARPRPQECPAPPPAGTADFSCACCTPRTRSNPWPPVPRGPREQSADSSSRTLPGCES